MYCLGIAGVDCIGNGYSPIGLELGRIGVLSRIGGSVRCHVGLGRRLVEGTERTVLVFGAQHRHTVRCVGKHRTVVVHNGLRDVALGINECRGTVGLHLNLGTIGHLGLKGAVRRSFGYLRAAVGEGHGGLAGDRVRLGDHALRVGNNHAAVRVLTAHVVAAISGGVGGCPGCRAVALNATIGHVLLDGPVVEGGRDRLVAVRGDLDLPTPVLGLHLGTAVCHQGHRGAVFCGDLLATEAPFVGELLRSVSVHDVDGTVAHLGDQRPVFLEERLVLGTVRVDALEGAVGPGHFDQAVGAAGHEVAGLLIENLLHGPSGRLDVNLATVFQFHLGAAVSSSGYLRSVISDLGDRCSAGDTCERA